MVKHWTEAELQTALRDLSIIADTREQEQHVINYFKKKKVNVINRKLDVGDYSAQLGDLSLEKDVVVERKASLDELCGNLTNGRDRFEREFTRAKASGIKVFLLIENGSYENIYLATNDIFGNCWQKSLASITMITEVTCMQNPASIAFHHKYRPYILQRLSLLRV